MPFNLPYPGAYPDPMDPQAVQDMASAVRGEQVGAPIPEQGQTPQGPIVASESESVTPGQYTDVPDSPGYYGNAAQSGDATEDLDTIVWGHPGGQGGQPSVVQPKQLDYDKAGGLTPIVTQQLEADKMASSAERQGQDAASENERLAGVYGEESKRQTQSAADWRQRQIEDEGFYAKRAQQIDQLGDQIARKKIDEGRWVKNPGNFFAAIGAALVGMGSGDATVGYRLIDQAIQRDLAAQRWENDQMRADKLGLENNVQLYRQLMGDRQAGDMVHEAKLRQSTAMKIEEISSQLRSKEARERGLMMAAGLRKEAAQLLQISNAAAFLPPQQRAKALSDAQTNFGEVKRFGPNQNAQAPGTSANRATGQAVGTASAAQGVPGQAPAGMPGPQGGRPGQPMAAASKGPKADITVGSTFDSSSPEGRQSVQYNEVPKAWGDALERIDGRIGVPGAGKLILRARTREQAMAVAKYPNNPNQQKLFLDERRQKAHARVAEAAKNASETEDRASKWTDLLRANEELKRKFKGPNGETDYAAIDSWLGQSWKYIAGTTTHRMVQRLKEVATSGKTTLSDEQRRAAVEYASKLQTVLNAYGHETSGGAITEKGKEGGEYGRLRAVLSADAPSHQIFSMSDHFSRQYGDQLMQRLVGAPLEDKLLYINDKGLRISGIPTEGR